MADKRMISKVVYTSGRFLKLPLEIQALYTHLLLHADDDGVVEAYSVLKLLECKEYNLKVLQEEGFIVLLNRDLVAYLPHWLLQNKLRADRKINSQYQSLLLKVLPDVKIQQAKPRADRPPKKHVQLELEMGRPRDGLDQYRLDQYRLDLKQQQLNVVDVPVVEDVADDAAIVRKGFSDRNLPLRSVNKFLSEFSREVIMEQLHNFDLNKASIRNPLAWIYMACKENYEIRERGKNERTQKMPRGISGLMEMIGEEDGK